MAAASSSNSTVTLRCLSAPHYQRPSGAHPRPTLILPRQPSPRLVVACSRRRNTANSASTSSKKKKKAKKRLPHNDVIEEDDLGEDAFEALFSQLEEDLKNDDPSLDGDDEIGEEDLAKLERELEEALGDDELLGSFDSPEDDEVINESEEEDDDDDNDDDDDDYDDDDNDDDDAEEEPVKLKTWQLRRLAYALKNGRRKTSIKNLAADVCLDRAVVLQLLREPPPNLLLMSAVLPDKPISPILEPESEPLETVPSDIAADEEQPESKVKEPIHVMQSSWSAQKRIKKVQVDTLERVYARTKRPTNAMISSIVHVTNLPRKRVVKWFEDKRTEDGVPDNRLPYQRFASQTVLTS